MGGQARAALKKDVWELYDTRRDFSLADDIAAKHPAKLKEMQDLFSAEAVRYNVLPFDDRSIERLNPALAGRPDLMAGRTSLTLHEGMTGMMENAFINVKNRSHTIAAEVDIPKSGVIVAQGGRFGGGSLYLKDGKPTFAYNFVGLERTTVAGSQALPAGKGGTATLSVNGQKVAEGRVARTAANLFSTDEGADVGTDEDTPVSEDYKPGGPSRFTGKVHKVTVEVK